jgi:hypothetical protein
MLVMCPYCKTDLDLAEIAGRCPTRDCGAVFEVYYDQAEAQAVADLYNHREPPVVPPAHVRKFTDASGWVVFFRDEGRLAEIAQQLL